MSISGVGAASVLRAQPGNERAEGPGPDKVNDHDADDAPTASLAASAPGTGALLDKVA